jgi:hypothetical protein
MASRGLSTSRRISHADRSGISRRSERPRFLQERSFIPEPVFAVLDDQLCAKNRCSAGGSNSDRSPDVQFCPQAVTIGFCKTACVNYTAAFGSLRMHRKRSLQLPRWYRSKPNWKTSIARRESFHRDTRICFLTWSSTSFSRGRSSPRVSLKSGVKH